MTLIISGNYTEGRTLQIPTFHDPINRHEDTERRNSKSYRGCLRQHKVYNILSRFCFAALHFT
jgi:hypothetical protein